MRHNLTTAGRAFRLRPIDDSDAALIVKLRSNVQLGRYLHPVTGKLSDQLAWLGRYYERPGDYYFAIERQDSGEAEGFISIYDIDSEKTSAEWGRWILKPGSLAATESVWLIYRCAFEQLALQSVYSRTVAENVRVVSFHDSCGIKERRLLPNHFILGDRQLDAIEHVVTRESWQILGPRLGKLVDEAAQMILRR